MGSISKAKTLDRIAGVVCQLRRHYAEEKKKRVSRFTVIEPLPSHMNELPCPLHPWRPWYQKKQAKFNAVLGIGVAWFVFSVGVCIGTGSFYLNWSPPLEPAPRAGSPPRPRTPPCDLDD